CRRSALWRYARSFVTVDVAGRPLLVVHDRQDREIGFILILMRMIKIMISIINKIMKNCINL
ncbi:hypothetical protein OO18_22565, partial [Raoultella ornithinolytica]